MLECLILGDSIAVDIHQYKNDCVQLADIGFSSAQWNKRYGDTILFSQQFNFVVISLGSNDYAGINTRRELEELRIKIDSRHIYWILPAIKPEIQQIVRDLASSHGDGIVEIPNLSRDGIHPTTTGYKKLAEEIK